MEWRAVGSHCLPSQPGSSSCTRSHTSDREQLSHLLCRRCRGTAGLAKQKGRDWIWRRAQILPFSPSLAPNTPRTTKSHSLFKSLFLCFWTEKKLRLIPPLFSFLFLCLGGFFPPGIQRGDGKGLHGFSLYIRKWLNWGRRAGFSALQKGRARQNLLASPRFSLPAPAETRPSPYASAISFFTMCI